MNSADKAWATRRANAANGQAKQPQATEGRNPDIELVMSIGFGIVSETDKRPVVTCSFRHEYKTRMAESALTTQDRALQSVKLVTIATSADGNAEFEGHDRVRADIMGAMAVDIESILPRMTALDNVLIQAFADAEDSSFPMALQAVSWNLRVDWIMFDGKRSKRGMAYPVGEQVLSSIHALLEAKA